MNHDTENHDNHDTLDRAPSRRRVPGWAGLGLCLFPAVLLAACGLASSDDAAPATDAAAAVSATVEESPDTIAASTSATSTTPASTEPAVAPISFASQVEPIIESTCANCHIGTGPGTTHIRLDNAGIVAKASVGISSVVSSGEMPPWPASDDSVAFDHDWSLTTDQVDTLVAWHEAGSPLDVADDHPIEPSNAGVRLDDPDAIIPSNGAFDGTDAPEDEYRCMVYELPGVEAGGFLTAMDFLPDQETVVHHAVGFLVSGADRAAIDELDAAEENGGWTCFGFNPAPSAKIVYGWAPGQSATRYDEGTGLRLGPGDFFVMQTHYHFDDGLEVPPPDQSQFAVNVVADTAPEAAAMTALNVQVMLGPAEIPCRSDESGPLCNRDAALAEAVAKYGPPGALGNAILGGCGFAPEDFAGMTDGIATSSCDNQIATTGDLVSVFGHEHEIGSSFRMTLNPDTPEEVVLLDIPEWDFDWQLVYEPAETITVEAGDVVRLECSWDRSLRDPKLEPAYVLWSEGTNDEMCFAMATVSPVDG
jgi:Copper type II ascorbate-dependent monooxygenase, N-terminal domain